MTETTKRKCPECDTEIEGDPDECAKCKLPLKDYSQFFRLFKTASKQLSAEEQAEKKTKEDKEKEEKKNKKPFYLRGGK